MFNIKKRVVKYLEDLMVEEIVDAFNGMSPHLRNVESNKYIEQEVEIIEHFKLMKNLRGMRPTLDSESATRLFIKEGYAKRYNEIYYEEITQCELRTKLFYDNRIR